jgi:hypothetical protein
MFPDFNFVDYVMILLGVLLCFKRVAEMERYHDLRVIVLTSILGVSVVLFMFALGSTFDDPYYEYSGPAYFCESPM